MYKRISEKILNNSENLDTFEKATLVSIFSIVAIFAFLNGIFFFIFLFQQVTEMVLLNLSIVIIAIINLYIIADVKYLTLGLYLAVINTCYYVVASTYLLGYNKNATAILPIIVMLIHLIFPKKAKNLIGNTIIVIIAFGLNIYIEYNVDSMYYDSLGYVGVINNIFAVMAAALVIYVKSLSDKIVQEYTNMHIVELKEEASIDFLTGLWNRRYIEKRFESEEFRNSHIVLADIDFFKRVNDEYGHLCGDYVLTTVADIFRSDFRNIDHVCRWGGEEFLIYMKHTQSLNVIDRIDEIRREIENTTFEYNDTKFNITITFGVTEIDNEVTIGENIERADNALYYGKNNGRNRVVNYFDIVDDIEK